MRAVSPQEGEILGLVSVSWFGSSIWHASVRFSELDTICALESPWFNCEILPQGGFLNYFRVKMGLIMHFFSCVSVEG